MTPSPKATRALWRGTTSATPRKLFAFCLFALILFGCHRPAPQPVQRDWMVMGTVAQLTLYREDAHRIDEALPIVQRAFARVEETLSIFNSDTPLARVNALAGSGVVTEIPYPFAAPLEFALVISMQSGGAFDPTIGPLMRLWGFRNTAVTSAPPAKAVAQLHAASTGFEHVGVIPVYYDSLVEVQLDRAGMSLDLGGVAKGFAVDFAFWELRRAGITNALINLGGNLRVMGCPSDTRCEWRTGIRDPFDPTAPVETLTLDANEAVATSGNYERFITLDNVRYAHILDGRTGCPVTNMASVTVVAPTAMEADVLSTTLFILGPAEGLRFIERLYPNADALWITDQPNPRRFATSNMWRRLGKSPAVARYRADAGACL